MVQEGKAAKVIACREARVKEPISGKFRVPKEEVLPGKMAKACRAKRAEVTFPGSPCVFGKNGERSARKVVPAQVKDGDERAKEVMSARVEDGDRRVREVMPAQVEDGDERAKEVKPARVEDGDRRVKEVMPAQVEDGDQRAKEVMPAQVEDGDRSAREVMPAQVMDGEARVTKVASESKMLQMLPEVADRKITKTQEGQTHSACDDLTLSQLFDIKAGHGWSGNEKFGDGQMDRKEV